MIEVLLSIPVHYFNGDFIKIEVDRNLAIYGDDLKMRIRPGYQYKTDVYKDLFTRKSMFLCVGLEDGKVKLQLVK